MGSLPDTVVLYRNKAGHSEQRVVFTDQTNRQLSHSPIESPPAVKKKLCRLAQAALSRAPHQGALDKLDAAFVYDAPAVEIAELALGGIPKSLETHARKTERQQCTILKKKGARPASRRNVASRTVHFRDSVTVFRMAGDGSYLCTECHSLQTEPTKSPPRRTLPRNAHLKSRDTPRLPENITDRWSVSTSTYSPPTPHPDHTQCLFPPAPDLSPINFTFVEHESRGLTLKFQVPLSSDYGPDDVVVKANMSGNRIRVVATPGGGARDEPPTFNERYPLPMDVDPYMVTARLDARGVLVVEAPVMSGSRKEELLAGN